MALIARHIMALAPSPRLRLPICFKGSFVYLLLCSSLCSAYCDEDWNAVYGISGQVRGIRNQPLIDKQLNQVRARSRQALTRPCNR